MAWNVEVATPWRVMPDGSNEMAVAVDYPTPFGWSDLTGQPDTSIPTDPNVFVVIGRGLTAAQVDALEADARYAVLTAEEVIDG